MDTYTCNKLFCSVDLKYTSTGRAIKRPEKFQFKEQPEKRKQYRQKEKTMDVTKDDDTLGDLDRYKYIAF